MKWILLMSIVSIIFRYNQMKIERNQVIESIEIQYHKGYDWRGSYSGQNINGGKSINQFSEFKISKNKKKLISTTIRTKNELRNFENGSFGNNLIKDSLKVVNSFNTIRMKDLLNIVNQIKSEESLINSKDNINLNQDIYLPNNSKLKFLSRIYNQVKKNNDTKHNEFLIYAISKYEEITISSITEWIRIEFEFGTDKYVVTQNYLGRENCKWKVSKNDIHYQKGILIPELNNLMFKNLPKEMKFKKAFKEYKNKKYYLDCLN